MANGFLDKVLRFIGFETEDESKEEKQGLLAYEDEPAPETGSARRRGTLVSFPGQKMWRVAISQPRDFDEVQSIADNLKNRRPVVLNLEHADKDQARSMLNFLSGVIYALNGNMQRVGNGIFLLTPNNVEVSAPASSEPVDRAFTFWNK